MMSIIQKIILMDKVSYCEFHVAIETRLDTHETT